jgi:Zn-dependent protease with chaperone function
VPPARFSARPAPPTRYAVFCGALALMAAAPAVTLFFLSARWTPAAPPVRFDLGTIVDATIGAPGQLPVPSAGPFPWLAVLVVGWLCGLLLLAVRQLGGFALAMRLVHRRTGPVPEPLLRAAAGLCARLGVRRGVRILQSAIAEVPSAIGWLRPVVLLPVSAVTAMTPQQLELLLAHELAHVKRTTTSST